MDYKIILFDGVCNFCNFWVNFILDRDKKNRFRFAPLQSQTAKNFMNKFGINTENFDTFILIDGEKYYLRSTAALLIAKELTGVWKIIYFFIIVPEFVRDFVYDFVAKNRYKLFGRRQTCRIPDEHEKRKFL